MLHCPSPRVTADGSPGAKRRAVSGAEYLVSFTMDGVEAVQNLPEYFPGVKSTFSVLPDPVYSSFRNGKKLYKGEALLLAVCFP